MRSSAELEKTIPGASELFIELTGVNTGIAPPTEL